MILHWIVQGHKNEIFQVTTLLQILKYLDRPPPLQLMYCQITSVVQLCWCSCVLLRMPVITVFCYPRHLPPVFVGGPNSSGTSYHFWSWKNKLMIDLLVDDCCWISLCPTMLPHSFIIFMLTLKIALEKQTMNRVQMEILW